MAREWRRLGRRLRNRRVYTTDELEDTKLRRCLNTWDLTALGLGSTLGVGVYVLVGQVALLLAGPSIVLSFLIAAVAALFAGLCYAEFGARVPRAGAAFVYTYVAEGQLAAFLVGWVNIFEYIFAAASVARGLSSYVDWAAGGSMTAWFEASMPIGASILSPHFDLMAFLIVLVMGALLATGARASSTVNMALSAVNMATIVFIIVAGAITANPDNWRIPADQVPAESGNGGFFPFGAMGMLHGAAVCFYGFVGFDSISAAGEEVKSPKRSLPSTIIIVLVVAFVAYTSVAIVLTMMAPYYELATVAAVFAHVGWDWAQWIVTVGALFGISASLFGALFPLPRLLYAMASEGLFFHFFSHISSWQQSPIVATLIPTAIIAILAGILELYQLVMMMSIGSLLSYTVVAACVLLLRYRSSHVSESDHTPSKLKQIVGFGEKSPSQATSCLVEAVLFLFLVACVSSALVVRHASHPLVPAVIINVLALALLLAMALQPRVAPDLPFKTPLVPIVPCISIYVNIHLMIFISSYTWIRVGVWILVGIPFYIIFTCCYKQKKTSNLEENLKLSHANKNGKAPIQIVVESPTPPDTMNRISNDGGGGNTVRATPYILPGEDEIVEMQEKLSTNEIMPYETEEIVVQHAAVIENNEEKEAKIIDMLDQVLQAEEDTYGEIISLKEQKEENDAVSENVVHRKSLSELSDAGSDASLGNQVLSKYDVIAQVHREDLPKVTEEQPDKGEADILESNNENEELEDVTAFNESDTNSRTDESGYSDTLDRTALNDSVEDVKDVPYIPPPPPMDENFFASPNFKKSYTVPKGPTRRKSLELQEEDKPRESIKSNSSQQGDANLAFGSDRQIHFMSKLNNIFQKQISSFPANEGEEEHRRRSNSTGNVVEVDTDLSMRPERPAFFLDLKKEIVSREAAQNLKPVNVEAKENPEVRVEDKSEEEEEEEQSMSRLDLKSKLESIYANGGPQMLKSRLMKSNPPTPEEAYQTDTSSTESIAKLPKMEKNDTLKRQKDKFGEVLNSFRLSWNKEDAV